MRFGPRRWLVGLALVACGSRTGLPAVDLDVLPPDDAGPPEDAGFDARLDARVDGSIPDANRDALPPIDSGPRPDVDRSDCPDADATLIYVITTGNDLYSFDPRNNSFRAITRITCPSPGGQPFSMAVDRRGIAYVVFQNGGAAGDGRLYRISTGTGACVATAFVPGQLGVRTFGMGFTSNSGGADETLFIATDNGGDQSTLGSIGIPSFQLQLIGAIQPTVRQAELTGTADGRLFAFYRLATGSAIGELDKTSGVIVGETKVPNVEQGSAWAFAFWGGDFYTFTSNEGDLGRVTRVRTDGTTSRLARLGQPIVGAGVSTCAPER